MDILKKAIEECREEINTMLKETGSVRDLAEIKADEYEKQIIEKAEEYFTDKAGAIFANFVYVSYTISDAKTYEARIERVYSEVNRELLANEKNGQFRILQEVMEKRGFESKAGRYSPLFVFEPNEENQDTVFGKYLKKRREETLNAARERLIETLAKELKLFLKNNPSKIDSEKFYFTMGILNPDSLEFSVDEVNTEKPELREAESNEGFYTHLKRTILSNVGEGFSLIRPSDRYADEIVEYTVK